MVLFCHSGLLLFGALSGNKTTFLVTSVEAYTNNTNGSSSTAQHSKAQHRTAQQYCTALTAINPTPKPTTEGC